MNGRIASVIAGIAVCLSIVNGSLRTGVVIDCVRICIGIIGARSGIAARTAITRSGIAAGFDGSLALFYRCTSLSFNRRNLFSLCCHYIYFAERGCSANCKSCCQNTLCQLRHLVLIHCIIVLIVIVAHTLYLPHKGRMHLRKVTLNLQFTFSSLYIIGYHKSDHMCLSSSIKYSRF